MTPKLTASQYRALLSRDANAVMTPSDIQVSLETIHEYGLDVADMVESDEMLVAIELKERAEWTKRINAMPNILDTMIM